LRPLDSAPLKRARQIETETETDRERERERERDTEQDRQRDSDCDGQTWRQTAVGPRWGRGQGRINQWAHWALAQGSRIFCAF